VAIIGISSEALRADEPSTTTADRDIHLVAELILLTRLALGDAFDLRLVYAVDLILVMLLLCVDSMRVRSNLSSFTDGSAAWRSISRITRPNWVFSLRVQARARARFIWRAWA